MTTTTHPWQTPALDRFAARAELPLLVLSVALIPVLIIPVVSHTGPGEQHLLDAVDYGIWAIFIAEYLVRLRLAQRRWLFVRHNLFDLALIAIPVLRPLRLARVARALRSARLLALLGSRRDFADRSLQNRAVAYVVVVAGALTLACSVLILQAERHATRANIHSYGDAIWWAVTTVSTVGYGDRYPVTALGRVIAVVLIFAGVSLFGVVTASVAAWFVHHVQSDPEPDGEDLPARLGRLEDSLARIEQMLTAARIGPQSVRNQSAER
jgi:voltage-gated potassium channel